MNFVRVLAVVVHQVVQADELSDRFEVIEVDLTRIFGRAKQGLRTGATIVIKILLETEHWLEWQ